MPTYVQIDVGITTLYERRTMPTYAQIDVGTTILYRLLLMLTGTRVDLALVETSRLRLMLTGGLAVESPLQDPRYTQNPQGVRIVRIQSSASSRHVHLHLRGARPRSSRPVHPRLQMMAVMHLFVLRTIILIIRPSSLRGPEADRRLIPSTTYTVEICGRRHSRRKQVPAVQGQSYFILETIQ